MHQILTRSDMVGIRHHLETAVEKILLEEYGQAVEPDVPIRYYLDFKSDGKLQEFREALDRLDRGTFGHCVLCSRPIPGRVLRRSPLTLLCEGCRM